MNARAFILDQLERAHQGNAWHGPALREVLAGVDGTQAATHAIPGAHSIWEIVLHITAWEGAVRRRIAGESAKLSDAEDWPPVDDRSEAAWRAAVEHLEHSGRALRDAIAGTPEARLDEPLQTGDMTIAHLLHGVVQHDLYHAGQIALLRKALRGSP